MTFAETIREMSTKEILILNAIIVDMLIIGFCALNFKDLVVRPLKDKGKKNFARVTIFCALILFAFLLSMLPLII